MRVRAKLGLFTDQRLADDLETLPRLMKRLGYRTYAVVDNPNIGHHLGFDRGFDRFVGRRELGGSGAQLLSRQVSSWKDEILSGGKFFLYLHFADPHSPYQRHAQWITSNEPVPADRSLDLVAYDSEIRHADEHIRMIFETLSLDAHTLLAVTSDHGQEFLDHGGRGHGFQLYSELTRVPLLLHQPGNKGLVGRVNANVAQVDLLPTLRDLLGEPPAEAAPGRSVLKTITDPDSDDRPSFASRVSIVAATTLRIRSVVQGRYKLIIPRARTSQRALRPRR